MTVYLDTSALVAWFDPYDAHSPAVFAWKDKHRSAAFSYNRILQLEVGHYLRRLKHDYAGTAWNAFRGFEGARLFDWERLDISNVFERAEQLSTTHKDKLRCGFWDLFHVTAALKAGLPLVTADQAQFDAAKIIGVKATLIE